jgi:hypothetical protein
MQTECGLVKPAWTAKFVGDSTFMKFRRDICVHIRKKWGYDVRLWSCRGGAWETTRAETLAAAPNTNLTIMSPDGNRLSLQSDRREPAWLRRDAEQICGGLRFTSDKGVVLRGDACLSPGLNNHEIFDDLCQLYANIYENLRVPLVNIAQGVELEIDGRHWKVPVASREAVMDLVDDLIENSALTETFNAQAPAHLWHWKYNPIRERHFPTCKICNKKATSMHLDGILHIGLCSHNKASFDFEDREQLCSDGLVFSLADNALDSRPFIELRRPSGSGTNTRGCGQVFQDFPPSSVLADGQEYRFARFACLPRSLVRT